VNSSTLARDVARLDLLLAFDYRQEDILSDVLSRRPDGQGPMLRQVKPLCGGGE
jgi:hypothetical protein